MVSDEEILRWAKEKYPKYADNIKLMRILYEKEHGRGVKVSGSRYFKKTTVSELKEGDYVELEGLVVEYLRAYSHIGCKKCFRKQCSCGEEKVRIVRNSFLFGDSTGIVRIIMPMKVDDGIREFEGLEEVVVRGRVSKFKDEFEIQVREYEILSSKKDEDNESNERSVTNIVRDIKDKFKTVGDMERKSFERYIQRKYGLNWDDVKEYFEVEKRGDEEWVVFRNG